jgi:hypothetical protein
MRAKLKKLKFNGQRYTTSWINELNFIPTVFISLAKWCKKNNIALQYAHKVLHKARKKLLCRSSHLILQKILYRKIHGRKICFIEKSTKRNELLTSKLHLFQGKLKNYITITEFLAQNKISDHGIRNNLELIPYVNFIGKLLIPKNTPSDTKQIKLNYLKKTYGQDYINTTNFAKLSSFTRTWLLYLIKENRIKNPIMLKKRWYIPKNTKIKNFKPWGTR